MVRRVNQGKGKRSSEGGGKVLTQDTIPLQRTKLNKTNLGRKKEQKKRGIPAVGEENTDGMKALPPAMHPTEEK